MTIEELLGYSAEQFAAMSDEELEKLLSPYIAKCRPEQGKKFDKKIDLKQRSSKQQQNVMEMIMKANADLLKGLEK